MAQKVAPNDCTSTWKHAPEDDGAREYPRSLPPLLQPPQPPVGPRTRDGLPDTPDCLVRLQAGTTPTTPCVLTWQPWRRCCRAPRRRWARQAALAPWDAALRGSSLPSSSAPAAAVTGCLPACLPHRPTARSSGCSGPRPAHGMHAARPHDLPQHLPAARPPLHSRRSRTPLHLLQLAAGKELSAAQRAAATKYFECFLKFMHHHHHNEEGKGGDRLH